eukprot:GHVU01076159.1.p1 GENE.GHVU01076159.1~~GHVU01076159.1.p1  ORF type:complete len:339 (-),score=22.61 GHVU01076159.1:1882-2898(-)
MAMVNPIINLANVKDSRWLTLEVCREYTRNKCTRTENECKFAHPPPNVEVQNGRVTCCFDSIKGKCQRKDPPCKYLHPPQHLREQLLQNGRNNLILRNLQLQAMATGLQPMVPPQFATTVQASPYVMQGPTAFNPYISQGLPVTAAGGMPGGLMQPMDSNASTGTVPGMVHPGSVPAQKVRPDRLEVCREFQRGTCTRQPSECRYAHPPDNVTVDTADNHVTVCMDFVKGKCSRESCRYFHPPPHLQAQIKAAQQRANAATAQATTALTGMTTTSGMPGVMPVKRAAFGMDGKMGMQAMYQPQTHNSAAYQQALAMQHGLQSYVPVSLAGHHPSVPRF